MIHVLRAQVLTLNYDNFVESGIHSLGVQIEDSFETSTVCEDDVLAGLPPCAAFPGLSAQTRQGHTWAGDPTASEQIRQNTFKLLKLHGSLSWYWLPESGGGSSLRRWRLPGLFGEAWGKEEEVRRQELPAHEVFVVPPASLKGQRMSEPVTKELWRRAAKALRDADRVVLVGYSLPLADHSISGMMSSELEDRSVRIQVVNPNSSVVESRLLRLGIPVNQIESIGGDDCIAHWTEREIVRLSADVVESLRGNRSLTGDEILFVDGPRTCRVDSFKFEAQHPSRIALHCNPEDQHLTNPLLFKDIKHDLENALECVIDVDGQILQVIDYWRKDSGGALMAQLHLVPARRSVGAEGFTQMPAPEVLTREML